MNHRVKLVETAFPDRGTGLATAFARLANELREARDFKVGSGSPTISPEIFETIKDNLLSRIDEAYASVRDDIGYLQIHAFAAERERSLPREHPLALLSAQYLSVWGGQLHDRGGDVAVCEAIFRESLLIREEHPPKPQDGSPLAAIVPSGDSIAP